MVFQLVNHNMLSPVNAASSINLSLEEFLKLLEVYNQDPENFRLEQ